MSKSKTLVKICGITTEDQAVQIAKFGVDAIGIISIKESPRYIPLERKNRIFKTLRNLYPHIQRVSVVKNYPIDLIFQNFLGFPNESVIQLHGDEDIDYCVKIKKEFPDISLWKAFRIKTRNDLEKIKPFENCIDMILLDSWNEETYGGSGKKIKSNYLNNLSFSRPYWLAGGVSIEWIDEILNDIKPYGLDISSSVEISPGIKNLEATKKLINKIKNY